MQNLKTLEKLSDEAIEDTLEKVCNAAVKIFHMLQ
jgi:hypothetical protein